MQAILFYLFYGFSWFLAQLPRIVIYALSDLVGLILYSLVRYRRKVVRMNLINSFPEKPIAEIKRIERKFYRHFSDLFFESAMIAHSAKWRVRRMCTFRNPQLLNEIYESGKSVVLAMGHFGNWELLALLPSYIQHTMLGVYKPLKNKRFEHSLNQSRERFGVETVSMYDAFRTTIRLVKEGKRVILALIADQAPASIEIRFWTEFLNQDTPVFLGIEKVSVNQNCPVVFCKMYKIRRGRYEVEFELLCSNPKQLAPYELTNMHVKALENLIKEQPQLWLWSHRRWKRKRRKENG